VASVAWWFGIRKESQDDSRRTNGKISDFPDAMERIDVAFGITDRFKKRIFRRFVRWLRCCCRRSLPPDSDPSRNCYGFSTSDNRGCKSDQREQANCRAAPPCPAGEGVPTVRHCPFGCQSILSEVHVSISRTRRSVNGSPILLLRSTENLKAIYVCKRGRRFL